MEMKATAIERVAPAMSIRYGPYFFILKIYHIPAGDNHYLVLCVPVWHVGNKILSPIITTLQRCYYGGGEKDIRNIYDDEPEEYFGAMKKQQPNLIFGDGRRNARYARRLFFLKLFLRTLFSRIYFLFFCTPYGGNGKNRAVRGGSGNRK